MAKNDKKILFIINNLSKGGAEGVFLRTINSLSLAGFDCSLALLYSGKSDPAIMSLLKIEESKIWKFNFKSLYDFRSYNKLIKKIQIEQIDVVYSTLDDANFISKIIRIFVKFKLFCREANTTYEKPLKFKIADIILNFWVHKLVMVAKAVRDSYAAYDPLHRHKMIVLYNGVEAEKSLTVKAEIRHPIEIIAVASLTPKKGLDDLVSIFGEYVIQKNSNFLLEIIGGGPLLEKINGLIKHYGLEKQVKCVGALDKGPLYKKYSESDIFVLTSKREGCPNALLRTMAYGLASVCFSVGAVPEIIKNGISGIVIAGRDKQAFGQAVVSLLENPDKIREIGKAAKQRIEERFSFDTYLKNLINILEL